MIIAQSETVSVFSSAPFWISDRMYGGIPGSVNAIRNNRVGFCSAIATSSVVTRPSPLEGPLGGDPAPASSVSARVSGAGADLEKDQGVGVEHRVAGHHRDRLAFEDPDGLVGGVRIGEEVEGQLVAGERPLQGEERPAMERGQAHPADRIAVVPGRVAL